MSNTGSGDSQLSKNQRREAAREKARALREQQKKKERRGRFLLQGSLIVITLAIVAIVTLVIVNSIKPPSPGPLNMLSDGIVIGTDFTAQTTAALDAGETPVASTPDTTTGVIPIQIWLDYQCPYCGQFEAANTDQITTLLEQGAATIEIHPVAILDSQSLGERYSSRAANAAACVANYSPNQFFAFNSLMFDNQPEEGSTGLTDDEIIDITTQADVTKASSIATCITGEDFKTWVTASTKRAASDTALLTSEGSFATPTVFVGGTRYSGAPSDATAFAQFVTAADGAAFSDETEASPSPSPSAP